MSRWFLGLLAITVCLQTAVYGSRPMVSYKALAIGATPFDLGVIAASFAVLSLLVAVPVGRWVDQWGEPPFIAGGTVLITATTASLLWIDSVWGLAVNQAALGLGHIMTVIGTQTLIANRGDPGRRDGRFGVFTVFVSLGQLVGPAAAGLLAGNAIGQPGPGGSQVGTDLVFVVMTVVTGLAVVVAASLWTVTPPRARHGADSEVDGGSLLTALPRVLRIQGMPHAMLASLTVLTSIDLIAAYLPAYGEARGLSVETVGLLLGVRAAASMATRVLMLPLIRLAGRRRLLAISMVLPAAALAAFPLADNTVFLYTAMTIIGFGLGLGQPVTLAWVAGRAPHSIRGTALAVRLSGNRLGQTALPVAVGAVAGAAGVAAVFVSLAGLLVISTTAVLFTSLASDQQEP